MEFADQQQLWIIYFTRVFETRRHRAKEIVAILTSTDSKYRRKCLLFTQYDQTWPYL